MMEYPSQIKELKTLLMTMPGVTKVTAVHTPLENFSIQDLSLLLFGDLPHATIRRTNGGLSGEALAQIIISLAPENESWMTLEFLSWQVRDLSRSGTNIQIRTRGLPPVVGGQIQLGTSLCIIIDLFCAGLEKYPEILLHRIDDFSEALKSSLLLYNLSWEDGRIKSGDE